MSETAVAIPMEFNSPYTPLDLVEQWRSNDLTSEEKKKPEAKYFYEKLAAPDPKKVKAMEQPCDPSKIIWPEQLNDLLNPGYLEVESGWCQMPNGGGFIANLTPMPGVTADMAHWWFTWFTLSNLRYKIWYRPSHLGHYISPERRKKILDPKSRCPQDTLWGATHHAVEDVGVGPELIDIHFQSPEDCGFDVSRFRQPYASGLVAGYGDEMMLFDPKAPRGCAFMCHVIRDVPGGIEWRTRFWMGYRLQNKKADFCVPPGEKVPADAIKGLALHNVHEYANFAVLLPKIHKEMGGRIAE
jgi:phloretin hydrolase